MLDDELASVWPCEEAPSSTLHFFCGSISLLSSSAFRLDLLDVEDVVVFVVASVTTPPSRELDEGFALDSFCREALSWTLLFFGESVSLLSVRPFASMILSLN